MCEDLNLNHKLAIQVGVYYVDKSLRIVLTSWNYSKNLVILDIVRTL